MAGMSLNLSKPKRNGGVFKDKFEQEHDAL